MVIFLLLPYKIIPLYHGSLITQSSSMDAKHSVIKGLPCTCTIKILINAHTLIINKSMDNYKVENFYDGNPENEALGSCLPTKCSANTDQTGWGVAQADQSWLGAHHFVSFPMPHLTLLTGD